MKNKALHCGACQVYFENIQDLNAHIENCQAAKIILPLVYNVANAIEAPGHKTAHMIANLHENAHLTQRYAYAVADDLNVLDRAKLHIELCRKLGFDYEDFRPFESEKIKHRMTRDECLDFLWGAIGDKLGEVNVMDIKEKDG